MQILEETGLHVMDLRSDAVFAARHLHDRDIDVQIAGVQRLSRALLEAPETILLELVQAAVDLCGADSAGISIEIEGGSDQQFYQWVATAGAYSGFLDAVLPRYPSACGLCLERGHAQHFTVGQHFFEILGVAAPLVTDGLLLPWQTEQTRGTIFIMAHDRTQAFDRHDVRLMTMLADFAAMGFRHQSQQQRLIAHERAVAAAQMANHLAHEINNPLQGLTNLLYLAREHAGIGDEQTLALRLEPDFERLSSMVKNLLELPRRAAEMG